MKERAIMGQAECLAYPLIASPCYGFSALSVRPHFATEPLWSKQADSAFEPFSTMDSLWINESTDQFILKSLSNQVSQTKIREPSLPKDPRLWSRDDVGIWVQEVMSSHRLPSVQPERFLMNGKALCLMSMDMFVSRVPLGGKLLYKDFQLRLSSALYS